MDPITIGIISAMIVLVLWAVWPRPIVYGADGKPWYDLRKVARDESPDIEECLRHFKELDKAGDVWEASRIGKSILKAAKRRGIKIPDH